MDHRFWEVFTRLQEGSSRLSSVPSRAAILKALLSALELRTDDVLAALRSDLGRSNVESYLAEVYFVKAEIKYVLRRLHSWASPKRVGSPFFHWPARSYIVPKPKGVVLNLSPWNYPFQIALAPAVSALAAGNAVLIKPSERAPATAEILTDLCRHPPISSVVRVVSGDARVAQDLLQLPWNHVFFTGSRSTGRLVSEAAGKRLIPTTLELSGNNLCVADRSADIPSASRRIALGRFMNAGQTCLAPNAVMVPAQDHAAWIEALSKTLRDFYGSDATKSRDFGKMISTESIESLERKIPDRAIRFGKSDPGSRYFAPALIPHSSLSDVLVLEESFAPVLPVVPYTSLDELRNQRQNFMHSLAGYVFSSEKSFTKEVESILEPASLCVNDVLKQSVNLNLPFGGRGPSGHGYYRGHAGFLTFSHLQAQTWRPKKGWDPFSVFPPYGDALSRLKRWL